METENGRRPSRDTRSSKGLARTGQTAGRTPGHEPRGQEPPDFSGFPEPFHISESTADGRRVIAPSGELDLSNVAELTERLAGNSDTVLDLSELSFMDSTGIHLILSTAERARSEGWEFTVRNPHPAVLRVIEIAGLTEHLGLESQTGLDEDAKQASPLT